MTKIEWVGRSWNPVTGCTPVSEGCENCYAARMAKRMAGRFGYPKKKPFRVTTHIDRLNQPQNWRKPNSIFVCSMGDLFHEGVDKETIHSVFCAMHKAPQHTYMLLTKRPKRMAEFFQWPLGVPRNWWLGVTAENQARADERIPILLQIPAAIRFVSVEPMLGPVELHLCHECQAEPDKCYEHNKLDWVICGGETGPRARPMYPGWPIFLRNQCQAAGVPFFFKHWGEWVSPSQMPDKTYREIEDFGDGIGISDNPHKVGKKRAGRLLDGQEWNEYPGGAR